MGWGSSYAQSSGGGKNPQATAELLDTASQWSCAIELSDDEAGDARKLLANGADVNAADGEYGKTALMYAVGQGKFEIAKLLASQGANINAADKGGNTVLMWALRGCEGRQGGFGVEASASGNVDEQSVQWLLEQGANPKATSRSGETALSIAAGNQKLSSMVKAAIDNYGSGKKMDLNSGVDATDANGQTALMRAVDKGDAASVQSLLEKGASADITDARGNTPLMRAVQGKNMPVIETLLRHGANVNAEDSHGASALSWAVKEGRADIVKVLLDKKAKIDVSIPEPPCYYSLLGWAVSDGRANIVKLLIDAGADVNAEQPGGMCPSSSLLEMAKGNPEIVPMLKAAGAK